MLEDIFVWSSEYLQIVEVRWFKKLYLLVIELKMINLFSCLYSRGGMIWYGGSLFSKNLIIYSHLQENINITEETQRFV